VVVVVDPSPAFPSASDDDLLNVDSAVDSLAKYTAIEIRHAITTPHNTRIRIMPIYHTNRKKYRLKEIHDH
jgi:hypothetical protein